jgi:hypothetical protein
MADPVYTSTDADETVEPQQPCILNVAHFLANLLIVLELLTDGRGSNLWAL